MLKLDNISKTFNKGTANEKVIFNNFNLNISKGEFVVIIGSNGSGKSTLMNMIAGEITTDRGKIIFNGKDITNNPDYMRARYIGRVFQDPLKGTASKMRVYENLALANKKGASMGLKWCIFKNDINKYKKMLSSSKLGLENAINSKVGLLSGGQHQALTLIMATMKKPKLLLLDEHTSALDPKTAHTILNQTNEIIKKDNITTLMITHNLTDAIKYGTRLIMLSGGKIILDVSGKEKEKLLAEDLFRMFIKVK